MCFFVRPKSQNTLAYLIFHNSDELIRFKAAHCIQYTHNNWKKRIMHAHFDCFSGAAGDMLLAALIDAAQDRTEFLGMI